MRVQIYHNPRCTKSRQTLALLEEKGISPEIVLYLENSPNEQKIQEILNKLGKKPRDIIRKGEQEYKDNGLSNKELSDDELVGFIAKFPKLLERPIVINGDKAEVGRPPENVLSIL